MMVGFKLRGSHRRKRARRKASFQRAVSTQARPSPSPLASSRKLIVILDDRAARSFAEVMGVTFLGTAGMLFHAFVKKHLTLAELEDAVEALSQTIWLAPSVVVDVLKKAREADR
jgi:predicted nucleic acid-binding protein